jgi:hypothetical protein
MVNYWLVNHNWLSFSQTKEYCGFRIEFEQKKIHPSDRIVYFGDGFVLGLFEAVELVEDKFYGWNQRYRYQVRIKLLDLPNNPAKGGLPLEWLKTKFMLARHEGGSGSIMALTEKEFEDVARAVSQAYIP